MTLTKNPLTRSYPRLSALRSIISFFAVFGLTGQTSMASELPIFSAEDVFEMEYANDPQVSPDGSRVAYVRTSMDIMTDRAAGQSGCRYRWE